MQPREPSQRQFQAQQHAEKVAACQAPSAYSCSTSYSSPYCPLYFAPMPEVGATKFFRRSRAAQGAYQVNSTSEWIRLGLAQLGIGGKRMAEEGLGLEVWPESLWLGFALRQEDVLQSYTTT